MHPLKWTASAAVSAPFALEGHAAGDFSITLAKHLHIDFDQAQEVFRLHFSNPELGAGRKERRVRMPRCEEILMLVDSTSVEIYLNDGEVVLSTRYYPGEDPIAVSMRGIDGDIWPMKGMEVKYLAP